MRALRRQEGAAMLSTILVVAIMMSLGFATISVVDTQTAQTRVERTSESAFNLAEAALNAQAFLLGRNWPRTTAQMPSPATAAAPCTGQTMSGTLTDPAASSTPSMRDQVQSMLAETYQGDPSSQWWITTCEEGGRTAWDASLLSGRAYDPSIASSPAAKPRRMWVRAEAKVGAHRRAVVALVQAGQQPVYPDLAVVTGIMGADLGNTLGSLTTGPLLGGVLGILLDQEPMFEGDVGLRCAVLGTNQLLGCLSGLLKTTSMLGTLGTLLQSNNYVNFRSDSVLSADALAQVRQQAQQSGTYYGKTSAGAGTVAANAACLPAGAAGKIVFIEQVGDGTASCNLNTNSTPAAAALIVGAGGVRVQGGGTFTGVIHTLRGKALAGDAADIRIEGGSHVVGGVYADDNAALGSKAHGQVYAVPPPVTLSASSPLCHLPLIGLICGTLDALLNVLGLSALLGQILPQLGSSMPAVIYNANVVDAVSIFGDSAIVPGTFRQVPTN